MSHGGAATHGRTSHRVSGTRMHTTGPRCTGLQGLRATAVFYDDAEPAAADVPAVDADVEAGELIAA